MILGYVAAQLIAFALVIEPGHISVFWPPDGVILAGFLIMPRRSRPYLAGYIFAATLLINWLAGRGYGLGMALSASDVVFGFIGARIYERIATWRRPLDGLRTFCALLISAVTVALLSASFDAALFHYGLTLRFWDIWPVDAAATLLGVVLVAPAIMVRWANGHGRIHLAAILESGTLFAVVLVLSAIVFLGLFDIRNLPLITAFVPAPFFVWASIRRSAAETAILLSLVTLLAIWGTAHGLGPAEDIHVPVFGITGAAINQALWIQSYLAIIAIPTLLMSAAMAERANAEHAMRERESILRTIVETSPDAIITIDDRGTIESFSASAEQMFGYGAAEAIGRNIGFLMPSPDRERHDAYLARYIATGERRIIGFKRVVTGRRRNGETFPMELAVGEAIVGGRRVFTGFIHDITRRQEAERRLAELQTELLHVSRLSDMGQLAASLAHELNQPLTAIMNYVQAMRHLLGRDPGGRQPKVEDIMEKVVAQAARAGQVIRRLRGFVTKGTVEARREDVNRLIEEANALALVGVREQRVRTVLTLAPNLPPILVDRVQIQQVLVNLIRNAIDAMANSDRRELRIETSRDEGGFVRVAVTDTGPGLSPDVRDKLFQPFVTSKPAGMGIGLSICRSIVEAHGGRLWHEPNPAGGAIFAFTLPEATKLSESG
ncbi:MAG: PAS domain S-box protein [Alphaproteobacteria bacterium]